VEAQSMSVMVNVMTITTMQIVAMMVEIVVMGTPHHHLDGMTIALIVLAYKTVPNVNFILINSTSCFFLSI
jgi:hypothetical protein